MKKLNQGNKKSGIIKVILILCVVLITSIITLFLLGKFTFTTITKTYNKQVAPQQQEKKNETQPAKPDGKVVYLTFDDGPSTLTGQFLDVLKEYDVKATFFMQGSNLQNTNFQVDVKRAIKEGHYIGAHSMTHNYEKLYTYEQFVQEMQTTLSLIDEITNTDPKLVRPPYGSAPGLENKQMRDQIVEAGIKVWDWTIDSYDWKLEDNPNQIIENVKKQTTEDAEVVLMHEKVQTLQALPGIIEFYKEQGYKFGVYNATDHFYLNFQNDKRL